MADHSDGLWERVGVESRWYVSFHGGEGRHDRNNLHAYGLNGEPLGTVLATHVLPTAVALRELRGFSWGPDGDLYVADAYKGDSRILRFGGQPGADGKHTFVAVFAEQGGEGKPAAGHHHQASEAGGPPPHPGLAHPFDVAFGPDGNLYVPAQDTQIVARCYGPLTVRGPLACGLPGGPMPHPSALSDLGLPPGILHVGTFVPAHHHVPAPVGLREVRHALFGPGGDLFVADRAAGRVKRYHGTTGALLAELGGDHLPTPIHLLFLPDGRLLAGSRDAHAVFALDLEGGAVSPLVKPGAGGLREPGGLALGPDGLLYVASRGGRQVLRFDPETGMSAGKPFLNDLPDAPEFVRLVADAA